MEKEVKGDGMTCLASICLLSSPKCEAMLKREGMGRYRWKGFLLSHQLTIFLPLSFVSSLFLFPHGLSHSLDLK